jgi:hypothetical protein
MNQYSIHQIHVFLKEGIIMSTTTHPFTRVYLKDEMIHLSHDHWHASLTWQDFLTLYQDHIFVVHEDENQEVDLEKDSEFYKWKQ